MNNMDFAVLAITRDNGMLAAAVEIFQTYWPLFWNGIKITLLIALSGTIIGLAIGLVVGGIRAAAQPDIRDSGAAQVAKRVVLFVTGIYVEVIRGTPMMVQAMFLYYALRPVLGWTPIPAGVVIVSINTGAYMAEIVRSGIQSVDRGQTEAARSIGMNAGQTMMLVVLPQAIRNAFPSIGNEFVVNIKDSSVLSVITVSEVFFAMRMAAGAYVRFFEASVIACVIYFVMTFTVTRILRYIERRMDGPENYVIHGSQTVPAAELTVRQDLEGGEK